MDIHIGNVNSTVRASDSQALLDDRVFEQLVRAVVERVREEQARQRRIEDERQIRPAVSAQQTETWE